jgi:hypothetical protein
MARTVRWKRAATATLIVATIAIPIGAEAQDRVAVALGAGGVFGTDPPPAGDFSAPLFTGSIQRVMKSYFALEAELTYWAHTTRFDYGAHDVSAPSGVIGRVDHTRGSRRSNLAHLAVLLWWLLDKSARQRATAALVLLTEQILPSAALTLRLPPVRRFVLSSDELVREALFDKANPS